VAPHGNALMETKTDHSGLKVRICGGRQRASNFVTWRRSSSRRRPDTPISPDATALNPSRSADAPELQAVSTFMDSAAPSLARPAISAPGVDWRLTVPDIMLPAYCASARSSPALFSAARTASLARSTERFVPMLGDRGLAHADNGYFTHPVSYGVETASAAKIVHHGLHRCHGSHSLNICVIRVIRG
jgi:hypothetical protein